LFNTVLTSLRAPQMKAFDVAGHWCDATIHARARSRAQQRSDACVLRNRLRRMIPAPLVLIMAEGGRVPQRARLRAAS
jgi:hypothetical protein